MKSYILMFTVALVAAVSAVGCGSSSNNQPTPVGAVTSAAVPAPGTVSIPTGCYYNQNSYMTGTQCAPCPAGYTQNGSSCIISSSSGCTPAWNGYGYACNTPTGYGTCNGLTSSAYSTSYTGCVMPTSAYSYGSNAYGYSGYYCSMTATSGYVCYYTNGAPAAGYYFNGYGWVRYM